MLASCKLSRVSAMLAGPQPYLQGGNGARAATRLIGPKGKPTMKSISLTERQLSALETYLLGTNLSICAALHACYIDAVKDSYFADELDSVSQRYLEERIFKCAKCNVWSRRLGEAREALRSGETPACEICVMSPTGILYWDIQFLRACGIHPEALRTGKPMGFVSILFNKLPESPNRECRLQVSDEDLDFLAACGIRVRLNTEDTARRKLIVEERKGLPR
jgi:hypothetical protein